MLRVCKEGNRDTRLKTCQDQILLGGEGARSGGEKRRANERAVRVIAIMEASESGRREGGGRRKKQKTDELIRSSSLALSEACVACGH